MKTLVKTSLVAAALLGFAVLPDVPEASAGKTMVYVWIDNQSNKEVSCTAHRKSNDAEVATVRMRAKGKGGKVFERPSDKPELYFVCGPEGETKKMKPYFDTNQATTHRVTVGCYNAGGCVANVRANPKPSNGQKA